MGCPPKEQGLWCPQRTGYAGDMEQTSAPVVADESKPKKPWFKKWWVWVIAAVLLIGGINAATGGNDQPAEKPAAEETPAAETEKAPEPEKVEEPAEPEKPAEPEVPAEYKSALNKAQTYSDMMQMSKAGIYDQLTAEYGEKFSAEAAQYGVDNVEADWKQNALEKARTYQETMSMSPEAIRDQLTAEFGEKFTQEEADWAIANL